MLDDIGNRREFLSEKEFEKLTNEEKQGYHKRCLELLKIDEVSFRQAVQHEQVRLNYETLQLAEDSLRLLIRKELYHDVRETFTQGTLIGGANNINIKKPRTELYKNLVCKGLNIILNGKANDGDDNLSSTSHNIYLSSTLHKLERFCTRFGIDIESKQRGIFSTSVKIGNIK